MRRFSLILVLSFTALVSVAQSFYSIRRERSLIAVGGLGTSTYFGELANNGDYIDAKPTLSVGLQYYFTNRIAVRAEAAWFQLQGDDAKADDGSRVRRNLSFSSNNFEISTIGLIDFFPKGRRFYQRPGFNLYGFAGVGVSYINPKTEYQGEKVALQPLQTEGVKYSRIIPVVPFGLGARLKAGPFFNIAFEGGYRKTFTDYLDDVSTVHKDPASFSDPVAAALADRRPELGLSAVPAGTQRGNPADDDGYFLFTVKLEYYLSSNFLSRGDGQKKLNRNKRKAFYRYNKRGGLRR